MPWQPGGVGRLTLSLGFPAWRAWYRAGEGDAFLSCPSRLDVPTAVRLGSYLCVVSRVRCGHAGLPTPSVGAAAKPLSHFINSQPRLKFLEFNKMRFQIKWGFLLKCRSLLHLALPKPLNYGPGSRRWRAAGDASSQTRRVLRIDHTDWTESGCRFTSVWTSSFLFVFPRVCPFASSSSPTRQVSDHAAKPGKTAQIYPGNVHMSSQASFVAGLACFGDGACQDTW